jgi:DNA replication protein DnaC
MLVDSQWDLRQEYRLQLRLRGAKLKQDACVEDIDYRHSRGLDKKVMQDLASCRFVRAKHNVIFTGATGLGNTWLACALAEKACRDGLTAQYTRIPRLVNELAVARADGSYLKLLAKLAKVDIIVLDDWGLSPLEGQAQHDMLEIIDDRAGIRSTLVTSQLPVNKWHDMVADPSVADAILDRLAGTAIIVQLKGESMRKKDSNAKVQ